MALSALVCLGRQTLTGLLTTAGKIDHDWTADYRLFSKDRFKPGVLFGVSRQAVCDMLDPNAPLVVAMDDTLLHKTGRKIHGAAWKRDPQGPPFQTNLIWAQRFIQISAALPHQPGQSWARMIPIDMQHAPSPKRPKKNDDPGKFIEYNRAKKLSIATLKGAQQLQTLRLQMDQEEGNRHRDLISVVDGGYTNRTIFKNIPHSCHIIGRIRKDAKIYALPEMGEGKIGRKRNYGLLLPTPEQIRQDDAFPWQHIEAWAAGKLHQFRVKTIVPIRWRKAGTDKDLRLVIIAPLHYRLGKNTPLLYRNPAYLICSDPDLPLEKVVQYYIWRWDIENNFRDEKTILGMGKAQVRNAKSVEQVPQFIAAIYAMLQVAAWKAFPESEQTNEVMSKPLWRRRSPAIRLSTQTTISRLRSELWGAGVANFSHFVDSSITKRSHRNWYPNMQTAVLYAQH